jgi:hypothetical protein
MQQLFPRPLWSPLIDALTDKDLLSPALSRGARVDVVNPVVKAYDKKGITVEQMNFLKDALHDIEDITKPRIIDAADFDRGVEFAASQIHMLILEDPKKQIIFPIESYNGFMIKSNLWVFFKVMKLVRMRIGKKMFDKIDLIVYVPLNKKFVSNLESKSKTFVYLDDCMYSGSQMKNLISKTSKKLKIAKEDSIFVLVPFATTYAIDFVRSMSSKTRISFGIYEVIGYRKDCLKNTVNSDIALCISNNNGGFVVFSLFELMGIIEYTNKNWCDEENIFQGKKINMNARMVGTDAIAFSHKVADMVSIPTDWFLAGPSLRHAVETRCPSFLCDWSRIFVHMTPYSRMLNLIDAMDKK